MIIDKDINKVPGNKSINGETEFVNFAPYNTFINKEINGKREIRNMLIHKKHKLRPFLLISIYLIHFQLLLFLEKIKIQL